MDKKIAALLGAVASIATVASAQAAIEPAQSPADALHASSYADLLSPVSNPVEALKADDAAREQQVAYYYGPYYGDGYYYHHHHHHHHHHHARGWIGVPGVGGVVIR